MSSRAGARIRVAICLLGIQGVAAGVTLLSNPLAAPPNGVSIERTAAFHNCLEIADHPTLVTLKSAVRSIRNSLVTADDARTRARSPGYGELRAHHVGPVAVGLETEPGSVSSGAAKADAISADLEAHPLRLEVGRYIDSVRIGVVERIRQRFLGDPLQVIGGRRRQSEPSGLRRDEANIRPGQLTEAANQIA
jgi:hypothetical protein